MQPQRHEPAVTWGRTLSCITTVKLAYYALVHVPQNTPFDALCETKALLNSSVQMPRNTLCSSVACACVQCVCITYSFLPRDAMLAQYMPSAVLVSVCLSQDGILLKRLNVRSRKQRHIKTPGSPPMEVPNAGGVY